jgi:hypothetical protein
MKDLWQRLSIDWPCALGDWLWLNLVLMPMQTLSRMKRRHVLHVVGLLVLLLFLQQLVLMDMTFLFGLDLGVLMEVSAAIFVLTLREQVQVAVHRIRLAVTRHMAPWRPHARQIVTRAARALLPPKVDDEDGAAAFA